MSENPLKYIKEQGGRMKEMANPFVDLLQLSVITAILLLSKLVGR